MFLQQGLRRNIVGKEEDIEEDAFEALFKQLEEDLKNDGLSFDDDDDEITEEDLIKLERELEEALAADDELSGLFDDTEDEKTEAGVKGEKVINKKGTTVNEVIEKEFEINNLEQEEGKNEDEDESEYEDENGDEDEEEEEDEDEEGEDEGPLELKRWQLRRLAYALKDGRRKTSVSIFISKICFIYIYYSIAHLLGGLKSSCWYIVSYLLAGLLHSSMPFLFLLYYWTN